MATKMRGHGEGSIRERHPGLWEARVSVGATRRSLYGRTRAEVAAKLAAALAGAQRGEAPPPERRTVGRFLVGWMSGLDSRVRPATAERYRDLITRHALPAIGAVKLSALTPQRVEALLGDRLAAGLSPRSVWHLRAVLRTALNDAVRAGEIGRNAAALARAPRVEGFQVEAMTPTQARAILDAAAGTDLEVAVAVSLWTGLRQGELLGLRWSDIDLAARRLSVSVALQRRGGDWHLEPTKTRQSRRTITLPAPAVEALQVHRQRQREARLRIGPAWETRWGDLVFTDEVGRPMQRSTLTHRFADLQRRAGLVPVRWHDLRHGTATLLLASGVDLKVISSMLGHSTITLTANTYAGVIDSLGLDAADRLAALVRPV